MPKKDEELTSLGEFSIGGEGIPQPKWIAPIVREVTFGYVDDTPAHEYYEIFSAVPAEQGYIPSLGAEGVVSGVPLDRLDTADIVGGITGEIAGEFMFGGMGVLLGTMLRPIAKGAGKLMSEAAEMAVRPPWKKTSKGYRIWRGQNETGETVYRVMSPDSRGRLTGMAGPNSPEGYIDIGTIYIEPEVRGTGIKYDLYNSMIEAAKEDTLKGIASSGSKRTSVKTDRWWFDNTMGQVEGRGNFSHLKYDILTEPVRPPLKTTDFDIFPISEGSKFKDNPMLLGNILMQQDEVIAVVPLRKLMGEDRWAPIRPGMADRIDGWLALGEDNIARIPDPGAEGLTMMDIKPGKLPMKPEPKPNFERPPSRGMPVTTDAPIESVKLYDIESFYDKRVNPDTGKVKGHERWGFLEPSQDPRIDATMWGVALDYDGYVESGGADFKAIIEPVSDLSKSDLDYGYYRLTMSDGTVENFASIDEAMSFAEKTKKFDQ